MDGWWPARWASTNQSQHAILVFFFLLAERPVSVALANVLTGSLSTATVRYVVESGYLISGIAYPALGRFSSGSVPAGSRKEKKKKRKETNGTEIGVRHQKNHGVHHAPRHNRRCMSHASYMPDILADR